MTTVSKEIIDQTWNRVTRILPENVQPFIDRLMQEQPFIATYLLAVEQSEMANEDRGTLMLIGVIILEAMSSVNPALRIVNGEDLDAAEAANFEHLEKLGDDSEMNFLPSVAQMLASYNQTPLLGSVIEALMEGNEEEPDLAGDNVGLALLHLKTVIDCLDQ